MSIIIIKQILEWISSSNVFEVGFFEFCRETKELLCVYGFSRHYQKKNRVGLERGPLSLVTTTEELLDRKVAAPV
jgi:hypothetical protein